MSLSSSVVMLEHQPSIGPLPTLAGAPTSVILVSANNMQLVLPAGHQSKLHHGVKVAHDLRAVTFTMQEFQVALPPGTGQAVAAGDWAEAMRVLEAKRVSFTDWLLEPGEVRLQKPE